MENVWLEESDSSLLLPSRLITQALPAAGGIVALWKAITTTCFGNVL